ncbi:MucR family transcriptional regulator [Edaphosphingomonas haloaromaticamans]|uniref:Transcriptional regulatory protein MucR n=1 Tax=Edaphosphingomonas haloaromaticamans TaxID=653954 RepID=A0A1S1HIG0_9SPHN|nr:MucR family transcriptional regulator [Sphingomonas haloaromaticamans]OHT21632.1 Transcriptional regulatory protein MucR [Sphingomonas haloaromaticamans]
MAETEEAGVMSLTVTLLSAYFANNTVPSGELPALVEGTRRALLGGTPVAVSAPEVEEGAVEAPAPAPEPAPAPAPAPEFKPAVTVEESLVSPDQILSLIDGKPYKSLKRHLSTHGLTPAEYRARYSLSADYPMVAPGYSAARREVAIRLGLGGKRKSVSPPPALEPEAAPARVAEASAVPAVVEVAPAKAAPVRRARTKAAPTEPATVAPKKVKRKAGERETKSVAAKTAPKPKRSRTSKAGSAVATPPDAASVEAPAAG